MIQNSAPEQPVEIVNKSRMQEQSALLSTAKERQEHIVYEICDLGPLTEVLFLSLQKKRDFQSLSRSMKSPFIFARSISSLSDLLFFALPSADSASRLKKLKKELGFFFSI